MSLITRFLTGFRHEDKGDAETAGLLQNNDGTVVYVKPNGPRVELGGGGAGGLPDGWTQDSDENVYTNGQGSIGTGGVIVGIEDANEQVQIESTGITAIDESGNSFFAAVSNGLFVQPVIDGGAAINASGAFGADAALDAGSLPIVNLADPVVDTEAATRHYVRNLGTDLPTSPGVAGSLWIDTAAGHVIKVAT